MALITLGRKQIDRLTACATEKTSQCSSSKSKNIPISETNRFCLEHPKTGPLVLIFDNHQNLL